MVISMKSKENKKLSAEQYATLYRKAFIKLDDINRLTAEAMAELEELLLSMGDE